MFQIRTDLAMETSEDCQKAKKDMRGISVEQKRVGEDIVLTKVKVETENGAKQMGKPKGTYITIESDKMTEQDEGYHRDISRAFSQILTLFLPKKRENLKVLVAGLGNREVTPDALGPQVVDHLFVTRHLLQEFGHYLIEFENGCSVSGIVPGVLVGAVLMGYCYWYSRKQGWKGQEKVRNSQTLMRAAWEAKWALMVPVIVLGGIYAGFFTPTEAAVVAVVYGIFIGFVVYRELKIEKLWAVFRDNAAFIAGTMFIMCPAKATGSVFDVI